MLDRPFDLWWAPSALQFLIAPAALVFVVAGSAYVIVRLTGSGFSPLSAALSATVALDLCPDIYFRLTESGTLAPAMAAAVALTAGGVLWVLLWVAASKLAEFLNVRAQSVASTLVLTSALVVILVAAILGLRAQPQLEPARTTAGYPAAVVLVSIDTLRADHVSAYGYERNTTPNLDRFATEGARFADVSSPSSWTLPTHLSLFTGLPPAAHGVVTKLGQRLHRRVITLAETFRSRGFETAGFVMTGYMEAECGHIQGFDYYDDFSVSSACKVHKKRCVTSPALLESVTGYLEKWNRRGRTRPLFLFVHFWDVHDLYNPPPPYDRAFTPRGPPADRIDYEVLNAHVYGAARDVINELPVERLVSLYDGEIAFVDGQFAKLTTALSRYGIYDDTLLAVVADHGDEFFEHGHWKHSKTLYQESIHVPLIIRYPPVVAAGRVITTPVSLIDAAPTLLSLAGVDMPARFGRLDVAEPRPALDLSGMISRVPQPTAEPEEPRPLFGDLLGRRGYVRLGRYKLIAEADGLGNDELYDLQTDPGEHVNLASQRPELLSELAVHLRTWRELWNRTERGAQDAEFSARQLENLRALGYLD